MVHKKIFWAEDLQEIYETQWMIDSIRNKVLLCMYESDREMRNLRDFTSKTIFLTWEEQTSNSIYPLLKDLQEYIQHM